MSNVKTYAVINKYNPYKKRLEPINVPPNTQTYFNWKLMTEAFDVVEPTLQPKRVVKKIVKKIVKNVVPKKKVEVVEPIETVQPVQPKKIRKVVKFVKKIDPVKDCSKEGSSS